MKKLLIVLLALIALLTACGNQNKGRDSLQADNNDPESDEKIELVVATIRGPFGDPSLSRDVEAFNSQSTRYHVKIIDYTQNGMIDNTEAKRKFNTEIISGKYPDMICFSHLSPDPYVAKGLLLNLEPLIDTDRDMSLDKIAAVQALIYPQGGLYYLSGDFTFETLVGKTSRFGYRFGWTMQEYLDIEAKVDPGVWIIYNMDHEKLLQQVAQRYSRTAVDWATGACSFNCEEFISILEASRRVQDKPETKDNMLYATPGKSNLSVDRLITQLVYVIHPYDLAFEEQYSATELSFIGWPTPDGSCGTDLHIVDPVGIVNGCDNPDGCWEFIKYRLLNGGTDNSMPMYLPILKTRLDEAQKPVEKDKSRKVQMTAEQVNKFIDLLEHIDNVAFYDETINSIIMTESKAFFSGDKTAEETTELIQSKVTTYVSEQR